MKVLESAENYLEAILMIREEKGWVKSVDVAGHLGFSKPSVSVAMKQLEAGDLIRRDKDGHISLTESGEEIAKMIYERHNLLTEIFIRLGVDPETARDDACKIEHDLSETTFESIKRAYTSHKDEYIKATEPK